MYLPANYICPVDTEDGKQCNLSLIFFNGLAHKNRSIMKSLLEMITSKSTSIQMLKCNSASKGKKQTPRLWFSLKSLQTLEYALFRNPRDRGARCSPWGHQERRDWLLMRTKADMSTVLRGFSYIFHGHRPSVIMNLHARQFLTSQSLNIWTSGIEHPKLMPLWMVTLDNRYLWKTIAATPCLLCSPSEKCQGFSTSWKRW